MGLRVSRKAAWYNRIMKTDAGISPPYARLASNHTLEQIKVEQSMFR